MTPVSASFKDTAWISQVETFAFAAMGVFSAFMQNYNYASKKETHFTYSAKYHDVVINHSSQASGRSAVHFAGGTCGACGACCLRREARNPRLRMSKNCQSRHGMDSHAGESSRLNFSCRSQNVDLPEPTYPLGGHRKAKAMQYYGYAH